MGEDQTLSNRLEAYKFLQQHGYKLSKSKLYKDVTLGKLRVREDGSIQLQDLWDYLHGERFGLPAEAKPSPEERRRFQAEQLGRSAQKNRYLSEAALHELIRDRALEWIKACDGDLDSVLEFSRRIESDVSDMIERKSVADNTWVILLAGNEEK